MKNRLLILLFVFVKITFTFSYQETNTNIEAFNEIIQTKIDSLYDEESDFGGVTIGIILPDGQKTAFSAGYSDMETKIKMKPSDRMLGGSTGKVFVSASIMQLVEKGILYLDDKVSKYLNDLPWFNRIQNNKTITIRNLLQHSSGISRYVFEESFQKDVHIDANKKWKPTELVSYVFDKDPLFESGTEFFYSDTNYILLAMVLEKVSGMSMYDYIKTNVLIPFKLDRITPQIDRKIDGLVMGYNKVDDSFFPGKVMENGEYKYNVQFEWAGGGFVMNTMDLALAGKLIYEGNVFDKSLMSEFFKGIDAKELGGSWGLGVHIKETPKGLTYGHSGFFPGYITNMLYFPEHKFSIAIQVNTSEGSKMKLYGKSHQLIPFIIEYLESRDY